jgi:hypothetical protein
MAKLNLRDKVELAGIAAVIVSLVILIIEVRSNTVALERQIAMDRANALAAPFFESELPSILAKIKSGEEAKGAIPLFMEEWDLSMSEAIRWERHLILLWETLEAQYIADGPSEDLDNQVSILLVNRDNQIYVAQTSKFRFSRDFRSYVSDRQANLDEWVNSTFGTGE